MGRRGDRMTNPPDPTQSDDPLSSLDNVLFNYTNKEDLEARLRMLVVYIRQDNVPYPKAVWTDRIKRIFKEAGYTPKPTDKNVGDPAVQGDDWLDEQVDRITNPEKYALPYHDYAARAKENLRVVNEAKAAIQAHIDAANSNKPNIVNIVYQACLDAELSAPEHGAVMEALTAIGDAVPVLYTRDQLDEAVREARADMLYDLDEIDNKPWRVFRQLANIMPEYADIYTRYKEFYSYGGGQKVMKLIEEHEAEQLTTQSKHTKDA